MTPGKMQTDLEDGAEHHVLEALDGAGVRELVVRLEGLEEVGVRRLVVPCRAASPCRRVVCLLIGVGGTWNDRGVSPAVYHTFTDRSLTYTSHTSPPTNAPSSQWSTPEVWSSSACMTGTT